MAYSTQANIESVFGTANVVRWSQLDPATKTADTARIALAIAYADSLIDDRFRGGAYTVPFTAANAMITDWSARIAGVWLYRSRPQATSSKEFDAIVGQEGAALEIMDHYLSGKRRFPDSVARQSRSGTTPFVVGAE